jgi:DNA-binding transcriptional LysR family regulator
MNLRAIDLNLLVILDALLDETHVSRAAIRLNLTQPAVSAALQRCRALFDDPLLQRGRGLMRRTPRADALRAPLKALLAGVEQLVDPPDIPLSDIRQMVRFIGTDQITALLIPPLLRDLSRNASGIDIVMQPWRGGELATVELLRGDADLGLSIFERDVPGLDRRHVLDVSYVVAMRRGHPAAQAFDLNLWLAYPHVVVSGRGERRATLDEHLERIGRARRVGLVVPSFQIVPSILRETDFIALLPAQALAPDDLDGLLTLPPPLPVPGFAIHLAWASRARGDKALMHVCDWITDFLAGRGTGSRSA